MCSTMLRSREQRLEAGWGTNLGTKKRVGISLESPPTRRTVLEEEERNSGLSGTTLAWIRRSEKPEDINSRGRVVRNASK